MRLKTFSWVWTALALAAAATPAPAERPREADSPPVVGVVVDSEGRPLPNVQIVVEGTNRTATTGSDGTFILRSLAAGTYHLSASLLGYTAGHTEVTVPQAGADVRVRIVLTPSPLRLEGLMVTGTPTAANPLTVTQSTVQLSGRDLDRNVRASVAQTLASEPGIATRYGGPGASTPVIRGLSGERVLVLENGQRTGDLSGSSSDHGLSVDPLSASRIEVVRGPASLLYGSSALGGVVNVIENDIPTEVPGRLNGYLAAQGESVNPGGALTGQLTVPLAERLALLVGGGGRSMDDVRVGGGGRLENSWLENWRADAGLGYIGERVTGGVAFGSYQFEYGLPFPEDDEGHGDPGHVHSHGEGVHIRGARRQLEGRAALTLGSGFFRDLNVDGSAQWYSHDEVEPSGEVGTNFRLNTQTVDVRANTGLWSARGTVGVSGLFRQYEPTGEEALTPAANSNSGGVFVYEEVPLTGLGHEGDEHSPRLQLGARYDRYRIEPRAGDERFAAAGARQFNAFSGSLGVNIPIDHQVSLGLSVARAFRAPTVEELFSNAFHAAVGSFDIGNPELEAETNLGAEGVLRAQTGRVQAQLSAYYNRISGYITPSFAGDTTVVDEDGEELSVPLSVFTQGDAELRGVEGRVETVLVPDVVVGVMGDLVRGDFLEGGPLPFMPAARLGASARWDDGRLSLSGDVRRAFRQSRVVTGEEATGGYTLVDLSAGYTLRAGGHAHTVTLRADNLLDAQYREATSRIKSFAPNPGRNLSLVYRVFF